MVSQKAYLSNSTIEIIKTYEMVSIVVEPLKTTSATKQYFLKNVPSDAQFKGQCPYPICHAKCQHDVFASTLQVQVP